MRAAVAAVLAVPALVWPAIMRVDGIGNSFFSSRSSEPVVQRIAPTAAGMAHHLAVVPVALVVLALGLGVLGARRARLGLAGPGWLWVVVTASILIIGGTYILGSLEIHWWLQTSVNRTTVFTQLLACTDVALWLVVATNGVPPPPAPAAPEPMGADAVLAPASAAEPTGPAPDSAVPAPDAAVPAAAAPRGA